MSRSGPKMKGSNDNRDVTSYFSDNQNAPASRTRNIRIGRARSSIRLEEAFWKALDETVKREDLTLNDLVTTISSRLSAKENLAGAMRVFIHSYFYALNQDRRPRIPTGAGRKAHKPRNRDSIKDPG